MKELRGKVAVITGGASGIGFATAEALAREGAKLVLADVEAQALDAAAAKLRARGRRRDRRRDRRDRVATPSRRSPTPPGSTTAAPTSCSTTPASPWPAPVASMTHEDWRWVIDVDLWGVIHGVEAFVPRLVEQGEGGHVLATASFAGLVPNIGLGAVLRREVRRRGADGGAAPRAARARIGASVLCPMRVRTNIDASGRNRQADYGGPESAALPEDRGRRRWRAA